MRETVRAIWRANCYCQTSGSTMSNNTLAVKKVIVLSGGTGRTGKQVAEAALAQFDREHVGLVIQANVRTIANARKIVRAAHRDGAVICHTLAAPKIREVVDHESRSLMVPTVDLLGPTIALLSDLLGATSKDTPGLLYELNKERIDQIDAVDFCLAHDDGCRPEDYHAADVVLVGVSRASKSVTCLYLAQRGIRAANAAITPECDPPAPLLQMEPKRVFALKMNSSRLQQLREARGGRWLGAMRQYSDPERIAIELRELNRLIERNNWQSIDVSYKAVEEVASEIVRMLEGLDDRSPLG